MAKLRGEAHEGFATVRGEITTLGATLRAEIATLAGTMQTEIAKLSGHMDLIFYRLLLSLGTGIVVVAGLAVTVAKLWR
jgi:hypothetical protein